MEQTYRYDIYYNPYLTDAEFDSKPQVMLVGQYSVGKTSFIRYLLGRDFPGQRIGPEPTTDRFTAVMDGQDERVIPGNALAVSHDYPFRGLEKFGVSFLNRFEGAQLPNNQVLKNITLIDTPGVLSGEKQRVNRGYDFNQVCAWFAQRADLILLLFDAHKLDISDEFKTVIEGLKGNDDKIRCILNKADQVDRQRLMRIYGALMWSLGKVVKTPEVLRVYIGTFWDQPLAFDDNAALFAMEEKDLMRDLADLPRNSAVRKINELVKRVRIGRVHAYLMSNLKEQMPTFMGHAKKQKELLADLPKVFRTVMKKYKLSPGDFPDIEDFRSKLAEEDFTKFSSLRQRMLDDMEAVLGQDIPRLMEALPRSLDPVAEVVTSNGPLVYENRQAGVKAVVKESEDNPWAEDGAEEVAAVAVQVERWGLDDKVPKYKAQFEAAQKDGYISGAAAKPILTKTGLERQLLSKLWTLSDVDADGRLDLEEFVLAMCLAEQVKLGNPLPDSLDPEMVPPSKR